MERIENNRTLDTKEWAISIFISSLPVIGFIMLLVWALSDETNIHKKNWAKGTLIIWVIGLIIALAFLFLFGGIALFSSMMN